MGLVEGFVGPIRLFKKPFCELKKIPDGHSKDMNVIKLQDEALYRPALCSFRRNQWYVRCSVLSNVGSPYLQLQKICDGFSMNYFLSPPCSARTIPHSDDIYYHSKQVLGPSVWHFSSEGLTVFGPTGSILKNPPKQETCAVYESLNRQNETETVDSCRFFTLTSDGHRYVWAGARGETGDRIEIFDIDTADFVGFANTCRVPMDLSYHASRQEMIVHCHDNQLDVLSSNALGTDFDKIDLQYSSDGPAGRALTHSTMGPFAFSGGSADGALHEIDLSSRQVVAAHALPDATGARNLAYSPVNRHVFVRPRVCCTCGTEGGDKPSCGGGRGGPRDPEPVTVTTGPNQGTNVLGVCGSTCEGSLADTIGVYEFDTVNKRLVGSVNSVKGNGATPQATADGAFILLFGNDGGKGLRVLKPGKTGDKSVRHVLCTMVSAAHTENSDHCC